MVGAILGVGMMNSLLNTGSIAGGLNWKQAENVGLSLLLSPVIGFVVTALLFLLLKAIVRRPELYQAPQSGRPPPWWIRGILCLTCTGVSYAHGSNDGQKGLGLLMLILAGIIPGFYAVNPQLKDGAFLQLAAMSQNVTPILQPQAGVALPTPVASRDTLRSYLQTGGAFSDKIFPALAEKNHEISATLAGLKSLGDLSKDQRVALRADIFLVSSAIGKLNASQKFPAGQAETMMKYKTALDHVIKFIPVWVKLAVALALGIGTMIGWKRVVVTIGEKIGKAHLTYAQGACAGTVAMITVGLASRFGLPVSTTHVLSSGVAGTMSANRSGLQAATLRNIILAWVLTLPACIFLGAMFFAAALMLVFNLFHLH
jgi:PiT family inorganic phosphate transporter